MPYLYATLQLCSRVAALQLQCRLKFCPQLVSTPVLLLRRKDPNELPSIPKAVLLRISTGPHEPRGQ